MSVAPQPATAAGRAGLAALLADPARAVVAVDFDGTLAPIVADPVAARPAAGAVEALTALAAAVGTCAVVTGRAAETVVDLGVLAGVPGLLVLGHYGLQRWYAGELSTPDPHPNVAAARDRLPGLLARRPGVAVEDKTHSVAVHTRRAGDPAGAYGELRRPLDALAAELGLELVPGRFVWELRPPGVDKGGALSALVAERRPAAVCFVGDDVGDLPAYAAVDALRAAGTPGLKVASRTAEDTGLAEQADLVLAGPAGVVAWLDRLAEHAALVRASPPAR